MKKIGHKLTALFLAAALSGCSAATPVENEEKITEEITTEEEVTSEAEPEVVEDADFRSIKWGMTKDEVIASEGKEPDFSDTGSIAYGGLTVANKDVNLYYLFDNNDKVYTAFYSFTETHTNKNKYIDDYDSLVSTLTEKYGKPIKNTSVWSDDLYKDSPSDYGFAVSLGHLIYASNWETDTTSIIHGLTGDNYKISHNLYYQSKTYKYVEDKTGGL